MRMLDQEVHDGLVKHGFLRVWISLVLVVGVILRE